MADSKGDPGGESGEPALFNQPESSVHSGEDRSNEDRCRWPLQDRFPLNLESQERMVESTVQQLYERSTGLLVVTALGLWSISRFFWTASDRRSAGRHCLQNRTVGKGPAARKAGVFGREAMVADGSFSASRRWAAKKTWAQRGSQTTIGAEGEGTGELMPIGGLLV